MSALDIIYYLVIIVNLIVALIYRNLWFKLYFLYFLITLLVEILVFKFPEFFSQKTYNLLDIFCVIFFYYLYSFSIKNKKLLNILTIIIILLCTYFTATSTTSYSTQTGILYSLYVIIVSVFWLLESILIQNEEKKITEFQLFWVSSSLILWSIFYIFRMTPMYFFDNQDIQFLYTIKYAFQIATIISYLLFLKALFCKY